ncbi:MAG: ABC transporter substrate-binding protein, partial [Aeromicrobium sp.]|nr:ABC transporter substrate-binding protein [Burkholderiales bacterium]
MLWSRSRVQPSGSQASAPAVADIVPNRANGNLNPETATSAAPPATFILPSAGEIVVKIGHVAPTSGQIAHLGKDNENGARLAVEEANAKGMMIDGKKVKFELIAEDDAADGNQAR